MAAMISCSIGATAIDAAVTSVTVAPPPAFQPGDFLVLGIIAGGVAATAAASAPPGWTDLSGGAAPGLFGRTATGSEPAFYTVTLDRAATAAAFVAAYPAATVAGVGFAASDDDVTSYPPPFPGSVSADQTVLLIAAAVASADDVNRNAGYQNVSLTADTGWTTEVPVFGPALPDNTSGVSPCAIGLAGSAGSAGSPVLSSPQGCTIYAAYLVLDVTGTASPLAVTATAAYPAGSPGMALTVKALSGAASPPAGATATFYADGTSQAPQASVTPSASGSLVYGAVTENYAVAPGSSFTPNSASVFSQDIADTASSCSYGTFQSAAPTTAGTAVTLGGAGPANAYSTVALAEILAAPGSTLAETATAQASGILPGDFATTSVALTAVFRSPPAAGSLLVAMISANSSYSKGAASVALTDSAGRTWTPLAERTYPSYCGVWVGVPAN